MNGWVEMFISVLFSLSILGCQQSRVWVCWVASQMTRFALSIQLAHVPKPIHSADVVPTGHTLLIKSHCSIQWAEKSLLGTSILDEGL